MYREDLISSGMGSFQSFQPIISINSLRIKTSYGYKPNYTVHLSLEKGNHFELDDSKYLDSTGIQSY